MKEKRCQKKTGIFFSLLRCFFEKYLEYFFQIPVKKRGEKYRNKVLKMRRGKKKKIKKLVIHPISRVVRRKNEKFEKYVV